MFQLERRHRSPLLYLFHPIFGTVHKSNLLFQFAVATCNLYIFRHHEKQVNVKDRSRKTILARNPAIPCLPHRHNHLGTDCPTAVQKAEVVGPPARVLSRSVKRLSTTNKKAKIDKYSRSARKRITHGFSPYRGDCRIDMTSVCDG